MKLTSTNPYLKNLKLRQKLNKQSVRSSCGVEGIKPASTTTNMTKYNIKPREKKLFAKFQAKLTSRYPE